MPKKLAMIERDFAWASWAFFSFSAFAAFFSCLSFSYEANARTSYTWKRMGRIGVYLRRLLRCLLWIKWLLRSSWTLLLRAVWLLILRATLL